MTKILTIIFFYLILITSLIMYVVLHRSAVQLESGVYINQSQPITHFELIDQHGNLFTETNLKDHWSLLFFGFSSCPMICPLTMQTLNQTYETLVKTKRPHIIFISVDPEHDSLQRLNQFIHQFNPHFIALRGEMSAINALQKQLHVSVSTAPMSHGTEVLLINPEAKVQAYFYHPIQVKTLVLDLNHLIN
ncbi:TPA: SCO family protein [Legionella anisa]|nr:SCO family protein [Legionella anisa]MCW8423471.1 SCO family protein [Legionella anisa]